MTEYKFKGKKEYSYLQYRYKDLHIAKSLVKTGDVKRLESHDEIFYPPSSCSYFETYLLPNQSIVRLTEGDAMLFHSLEGYSVWLTKAKCIDYAVEKWGVNEVTSDPTYSFIRILPVIAEIMILSSLKYNVINESIVVYLTLEDHFLHVSDEKESLLFPDKESLEYFLNKDANLS